jgi:4-amino-4-deoxy-L-arabinose transferase-like glycosyltransferase
MRQIVLAAGIVLAAYLTMASCSTLWDRDEARFARAAVEMVQSGNTLYATLNGQVRPDKPILIYWLMGAVVQSLGTSVVAFRLWSVLGAAAACLLTAVLAGRLFGGRAPLIALLALATSPLMVQCGTAATVDALLLALIVGSMLTFVHALEDGAGAGHFLLLGLLTAATILLKGPAGLLVPVFIIPVTWWLARRQTPLRFSYLLGVGAVLACGVAAYLAWALPANNATSGVVLGSGIGKHVVERSLHPMEGHGTVYVASLPTYLFVILLAFYPWTLYLPAAISASLGGRLGRPLVRPVLIGWAVPVFILVTLVATKLPHYALPIWPALALAVAGLLVMLDRNAQAPRDLVWLRRGVWFMLPVGLLLCAGIGVAPWLKPLAAMRLPCGLMAAVMLITTLSAVRSHRRGQHPRTARILGIGMATFWLLGATLLLPAFERYKPAPPLARAINERVGTATPVVTYDFQEPSLIFYLGRREPVPRLDDTALVAWAKERAPGVLVISAEGLARVQAQHGDLRLRPIAEREGLNYSNGKWVRLLALQRGG